MITAPRGWSAHPDGDGVVLLPPGGLAHGTIRYQERVRPLRPVRDLVAALAPPGWIERRRGAIERIVTAEGEHAALVTSEGMLDGRPVERTYGFVLADDFHSAIVAEVTDGREACLERFARVRERLVGEVRIARSQRLHQTLLAGAVAFQVHVAVDQAGQDIAFAQVDDGRAGITVGRSEAVADRFDPTVADDDGRWPTRLLAWTIQQAPCVNESEGVGSLREGSAGGEREQGED